MTKLAKFVRPYRVNVIKYQSQPVDLVQVQKWEDRHGATAAPSIDKGGMAWSSSYSKSGSAETRTLNVFQSKDGSNRLPQRNGQLIIHALRTVSSTFITDAEGSALRIRRVLTPERVREYGYEELYWLAHEVKALIPLNPDLVADIYIASFEWTETDEGATPMSHSEILPMVSNKRQDFQHARWQLSQDHPKFVEKSPLAAARAMVAVVSAYCREKVVESQKWRDEFRKLIESDHPVDGTAEAMLDDDTEF